MRCYVLCLVNKLCFLMWEGGGEGLIERGAYKKFDLQTRGLIVIREVLCFLFFFFFFFFFFTTNCEHVSNKGCFPEVTFQNLHARLNSCTNTGQEMFVLIYQPGIPPNYDLTFS